MPVSKDEFDKAKNATGRIQEFLAKNPDMAYSLKEISKELEIPEVAVSLILSTLMRFNTVEAAYVKGDRYYRIKKMRGKPFI